MSEASALLDAQRGFAAALRSSALQQRGLTSLDGDAARNAELLAVYRGNAVTNVRKALGLIYPVIERIVGDEFFSGLCRAYWAVAPSRCGDLNEYGATFADFLAGFPYVAELPYLPDVARVEWLAGRAAHAADHAPCVLAQLAQVAPESVGDLRFGMQNGLSLVSSLWPVASIWQQHQVSFKGEIDIDLKNAECIAVHRLGLRVDVVKLSPAEGALWLAALQGLSLATMLATAFAIDEFFDVQGSLRAGFAREFVTSLSGPDD
jgi:hypothetical protein